MSAEVPKEQSGFVDAFDIIRRVLELDKRTDRNSLEFVRAAAEAINAAHVHTHEYETGELHRALTELAITGLSMTEQGVQRVRVTFAIAVMFDVEDEPESASNIPQ